MNSRSHHSPKGNFLVRNHEGNGLPSAWKDRDAEKAVGAASSETWCAASRSGRRERRQTRDLETSVPTIGQSDVLPDRSRLAKVSVVNGLNVRTGWHILCP